MKWLLFVASFLAMLLAIVFARSLIATCAYGIASVVLFVGAAIVEALGRVQREMSASRRHQRRTLAAAEAVNFESEAS